MLINVHSSANRLNLQQYIYRTSLHFAKFTALFKDVGAGIHPSLTLCVFVIELLEEAIGKTQWRGRLKYCILWNSTDESKFHS
jgi:hypothetical protein